MNRLAPAAFAARFDAHLDDSQVVFHSGCLMRPNSFGRRRMRRFFFVSTNA